MYLLIALSVVAVLLIILVSSSVVVVGGDKIALLERRWFGKKMQQDQVVALNNEVGIQARMLGPGLHFLIPFIYKTQKSGLIQIQDGEVGLIESIDGSPVVAGKIFAKVVTGHNSFQDGEAFLKNGGEKGPQIEILPPGKYRINPYLFKLNKCPAVVIGKDEIGCVTAQDGVRIDEGRLLAKRVENHSSFQDGEAFLKNGGQKGPQIEILLPGTYRINLNLFSVAKGNAVVIEANNVGLVTALDGVPLRDKEYVASSVEGHNDFQDASTFILKGGQRGSQFDVLKPGKYYINPFMFKVELDDVAIIERGQVGVVVSNVGKEPTDDMKKRLGKSQVAGKTATEESENESLETYVVPTGFRGIQEEVVGPGKYYLNRRAFIPYIINTTNITIDWDELEDTQFNSLNVISKDGFPIQVSVKVVIRVRPDQAPYMVAKVGSIESLVTNVIHPMIDSSFRNQASTAPAMGFMQNRSEEQDRAEARARLDLEKYHVECVSVLICQIQLPQELMQTQTKRIIAEQQQEMFKMEQKSQSERTEMEKMKATADQQPELVKSEIAVKVATQKKQEMITLAEGKAASLKLEGQGEGDKIELAGKGEAAKIDSIGKATANAYKEQKEAMGQDSITTIKIVELITNALKSGTIKIVPDVLVTGGANAADGLMGTISKILPGININSLLSKFSEPKKVEQKIEKKETKELKE